MKKLSNRQFKCLFTIAISCFSFLFSPQAYSQSKTVTIKMEGVAMENVMSEIEKQTQHYFVTNKDIDLKRTVSVDVMNGSLADILSQLLRNSNINYTIQNSNIILSVAPQPTVVALSGKVTDASGMPVIGASVAIKGTTTGVTTGRDGSFALRTTTASDAVLTVSFIGYQAQEIPIAGRTYFNVVLDDDMTEIETVVVTALGIRRSEKALSYNVQQISSDEMNTVKSASFMSSLIGKAAGVNINSSATGSGGAVKVVMRGAKSISESNNALYVIDGIPMFNPGPGNLADGLYGSSAGGDAASDINSEDIESISFLTGPSAAALYGYEGANGVVLITTKKGRSDRTEVTVSNSTTFSNPLIMPQFQNTYGNRPGEFASWGDETTMGYDPSKFFNTGSNVINNVSLSTGNQRNQTYISVGSTLSDNIVPNSDYNRFNFNIRNTTSFLDNRFKVDFSFNYINSKHRNPLSQGQYYNPLTSLYLFPRGEDFNEARIYERYSELQDTYTQFWPYGEQGLTLQNPYWVLHRMTNITHKRRYYGAVSLQYDITDWLNVKGRMSIDNSDLTTVRKIRSGSSGTLTGRKGRMDHYTRFERQTYGDVMLNIDKRFDKFSIAANIGGSIKDLRYEAAKTVGDLRDIINYFTLENLTFDGYYKVSQDVYKRQTQSVFGNVELGYNNMLYLTLTGRNDWDSALNFSESGESSFFYPSVGLSGIISEMAPMPKWFNYLKARLSFTQVGNSYPPYLTKEFYEYNDQSKLWGADKYFPNRYLKPEMTTSFEAGMDMRFLGSKINLSFTYYTSNTKNQTFVASLPGASGYEGVYVQAGNVQNRGVEASLGYNNKWNGFGWETSGTFTYNKNIVKNLAQGVTNPVTGEPIQMEFIDKNTLGSSGSPHIRLTKGGTMGDLYTNREFHRDDNGYIYLDYNTSTPSLINGEYRKVGTLTPKAHAGWRNSFNYKGVRLNVLLSGRFGGNVVSNTQAIMDYYGVSKASAKLRQTGITMAGQNVTAENYYSAIAAGTGQGAFYVYKATNIRLQELSVEYTIPRKWLGNIADITVGFVANNLALIYCKAPFDPELVASATDTYYTGVDYFMMPSLRNLGFSVKIHF